MSNPVRRPEKREDSSRKQQHDESGPNTPESPQDADLDEALDESFPASDPPAATSPGHRVTGATDGGRKSAAKG